MLKTKSTLVALACAAALVACGGGGGDDAPAPPDASVVGLWTGSASTGVTLDGVVLPDGGFWVIYSSDASGAFGLLQGQFTAGSGSFSLGNGVNFDSSAIAAQSFSASGSYGAADINGRATYSSGVNDTFTMTRQPGYDTPTSLAALQGTWRGTLGMLDDEILATITVAADGSFTGSESLGCRFSGRFTLRPEAKAPVNMTLTLNPSFCDSGDTITGVAMPWSAGQLALAAQLPRRNNAVFGLVSRLPT